MRLSEVLSGLAEEVFGTKITIPFYENPVFLLWVIILLLTIIMLILAIKKN